MTDDQVLAHFNLNYSWAFDQAEFTQMSQLNQKQILHNLSLMEMAEQTEKKDYMSNFFQEVEVLIDSIDTLTVPRDINKFLKYH